MKINRQYEVEIDVSAPYDGIVLESTFHLKFRDRSRGSAFMILFKGENYIVTAGHVVSGIKYNDVVYIFKNRRWQCYDVNLVLFGSTNRGEHDVAILKLNDERTSEFNFSIEIDPTTKITLGYGEQAYFLGFPLGLQSDFPETFNLQSTNSELPLAFLKTGIISNFGSTVSGSKLDEIYLDAHINQGFSGGPVFVKRKNLVLFGIITSFIPEQVDPNNINNSGIAACISFSVVLELLQKWLNGDLIGYKI